MKPYREEGAFAPTRPLFVPGAGLIPAKPAFFTLLAYEGANQTTRKTDFGRVRLYIGGVNGYERSAEFTAT